MSPTIARVSEVESVQPLGVRIGPELTVGGTYFQTLVQRGPLAYWRLGELGFVQDVIGDHYGVFVNTPSTVTEPTLAASLAPGEPNPSILLGIGVSIEVPYGTWMDTDAFSFEGIFEITGTTTTPGAVVVRASVEKFCWGLLVDGDQLELTTSAQSESVTLTNGVYHYVVTGDTSSITLFLNGLEQFSLPAQPDMNTGGAFSFGAVLPGFSYEAFPGRLDEYVYYDFKLSSLDAYADWLLWSTGQAGSIDRMDEVDTVRANAVTPRLGTGETYRSLMLDHGAWSYWAHDSSAAYTPDYGERGHDALGSDSYTRRYRELGPTQPGFVENPGMMANSRTLASYDTFASSECTISAWLMVEVTSNGAPSANIPLLCMAPSEGAGTFDKCLYLDTSGHLCWRTGISGSVEVITDPDPFPQDAVARHIAVSVGPDGTKIRVSGDEKVTGSNTTSWTGDQQVFYFTGGSGFEGDPDAGAYTDTQCWLQATVFDEQLTDAQTDAHHAVGRSIRNIEFFWGVADYGYATTFGSFDDGLSGSVTQFTGSPGILTNDPQLGSTAITTELLQETGSGAEPDTVVRHVYWQPSGLTGTQHIFSLQERTQQFATFPQGILTVSHAWRLECVGGDLRWTGMMVSNHSIQADQFTHSVPIVDGMVNAVGMELNGTALDLWVNGVKESFTRSETGDWFVISLGNQQSGYVFGATVTPSPFTALVYENLMTGRVAEAMYSHGNLAGGDYNIPELFFEDLARNVADLRLTVPKVVESETSFELEVGLDVANQSITIDRVDETDLLFEMNQIPPSIQTLVEVDTVQIFVQAGDPVDTLVQGVGQVTLVDELLEFFAAELRLRILDPTVVRAPTSITVMLSGGVPYEDVVFAIDGVPVYTVSLDSDGNLGPTSINVNVTLGTMGSHLLSVTQTTSEGVTSDSQTFTVLRDPSPFPGVAGVDAPPVEVPDALVFEGGHFVRHWVFQDLLAEVDGGIGSYVLPHSPRNMTSPHLEHALTSRHSTAHDGKIHIFQAGNTPKEWQFTGYCPSEQQQAKMMEYRNLNRRFYVIDHRNRAWKVAMTSAVFVPRLRQNYNGIPTDWGSDYTMTAVVIDQNYLTPEEV